MIARLLPRLLLWTSHPSEFVCCGPASSPRALARVGGELVDVTAEHLFLGYAPILLALPPGADRFVVRDDRGDLGTIALRPLAAIDETLVLYEGHGGAETILGPLRRTGARILAAVTPPDPHIPLDAPAQARIRVAYAIPRAICLLTVPSPAGVNRFPTDLHGPLPAGRYAISLRTGSRSGEQLRAGGGILSDPRLDEGRAVYALGRNHMRDGGPGELRAPASGWKELAFERRLDPIGIHEVHLMRVVAEAPAGRALFHVHRHAAIRRSARPPGS